MNLSSFNNEIVQKFHNSGNLLKLYCQDFDGIGLEGVMVTQFSGTIYSKIAKLFSFLLSWITGWTERMIYEKLFELMILRDIDYSEIDTLLLLRATSPNVCRKAKKYNVKVVGLISTFPRKLIRERIRSYERKWGIKEHSDYTQKRRVKEYDRILNSWNEIISLSGAESVRETISSIVGFEQVRYPDNEFGINRKLFFPDWGIKNEEYVFVVTTDTTLKKGLLEVLEVWNEFVAEFDFNIRLKVIGKVSKPIKKLIDRRFKTETIEWIGYVNNLQDYYKSCFAYICPSIIDMGPRTIKQAMGCGSLVIASKQCGASSFITHQKEGLVFDVEIKGELINCLRWVLNNRGKIDEIRKASFRTSQLFDNNLFAGNIFQIVTDRAFE